MKNILILIYSIIGILLEEVTTDENLRIINVTMKYIRAIDKLDGTTVLVAHKSQKENSFILKPLEVCYETVCDTC